jgi:hypothetical protein
MINEKLTDDEIVEQVFKKMNINKSAFEKSGSLSPCFTFNTLQEAIRLTREQCEKEQKDKVDKLKSEIDGIHQYHDQYGKCEGKECPSCKNIIRIKKVVSEIFGNKIKKKEKKK